MIFTKKHLIAALAALLSCGNLWAQAPKRDLRAAWIASVVNIDWPSKNSLTAQQQQQELVRILDTHRAHGMNAVIVQVRPTADAFYPSSYEPWSVHLSGEQGRGPQPHYNPLAFMIEQAHARNMEFHAWFNPYRISMGENDRLSADHPYHKHPEWFVKYGNKLYYNPGVPEARAYVLETIMEVVRHYDLDAVHFDDYFYPYREPNADFPDQQTYERYGAARFAKKDDWRRDNVDWFVQQLSARIKAEKPFVKFGISPFGVWRNQDKDPARGSATQAGQTNYDDLYADVLKWLREGWIDYVTPQLYWPIGFDKADYAVLIDWWNRHSYGKHVYIGHGLYRVGESDKGAWADASEIPNQLRLRQGYAEVKGSMFFSSKSIDQNKLGVGDSLKTYFAHEALVPEMAWLKGQQPAQPRMLAPAGDAKGVVLNWEDDAASPSAYYAVYRLEGTTAPDLANPAHIVGKVRRQPYAQQQFVDRTALKGKRYTYVVTALDRLHVESAPSAPAALQVRKTKIKTL